jgi:hypothetical protein
MLLKRRTVFCQTFVSEESTRGSNKGIIPPSKRAFLFSSIREMLPAHSPQACHSYLHLIFLLIVLLNN